MFVVLVYHVAYYFVSWTGWPPSASSSGVRFDGSDAAGHAPALVFSLNGSVKHYGYEYIWVDMIDGKFGDAFCQRQRHLYIQARLRLSPILPRTQLHRHLRVGCPRRAEAASI
jgi:hypothetical protein